MIFSVEKDECLLGEKLRRPFRILGAWNKNLSTLATNDRHCTVYTTLLIIIIIKIDSYVIHHRNTPTPHFWHCCKFDDKSAKFTWAQFYDKSVYLTILGIG